MATDFPVVVVGAGIAGLAYAAEAAQLGEVAVLEASARVGGEIVSERVDGRLCEHAVASMLLPAEGVSTLVTTTAAAAALVEASPAARRRWIHDREGLVALPTSPPEAITTPVVSPWAKIGALLEVFVRPLAEEREESVADFLARRFGAEVAAVIAQPVVAGTFGGSASRISVDAAFPVLRELEREGGVIRGGLRRALTSRRAGAPRARLHSFAEGMETLPRAVAASLGDAVATDWGVEALERTGDGWRIHGTGGSVTTQRVCLAVGAEQAAALVAPHDDELAVLLRGVKRAPIAVVHLGLPAGTLTAEAGFGYLAHPRGGSSILGAVFDSMLFPDRAPAGEDLVRVLVGGALRPELVDLGDEALVSLALRDLGVAWGRTDLEAGFANVVRNQRGIPQFEIGHAHRIAEADRRAADLGGIDLVGWSYRAIGLGSGIADAVRQARSHA